MEIQRNRPVAIVLAATDIGTLLVNRYDYNQIGNCLYGVGCQVLNTASYERDEITLVQDLLQRRRDIYGGGVVAVDCGANVGCHTVAWASLMSGWGEVIAIEAQERVYYMLAGNIAMNNCFNARAIWAAVGEAKGSMEVPVPDYLTPSSFGSLEIRNNPGSEFIGQRIDYTRGKMITTPLIALDDLRLDRADLLKIDVEGMEMDVLRGATATILKSRPVILVEMIKTERSRIERFLSQFGYEFFPIGMNLLCLAGEDQILKRGWRP